MDQGGTSYSSEDLERIAYQLTDGLVGLGTLESFERAGEIAYSAKDWERSIQLHSEAIRRFGDKVKWKTSRRLSGSLARIKALDPADVWAGTWPPMLQEGDALLQKTISESVQDPTQAFRNFVERLGLDLIAAEAWGEAYAALLRFLAKSGTLNENRCLNEVPPIENCRKLIVSGMGWSGSGAIYDYLREFPEVTAVSRELRHIEGKPSLLTLSKLTDDRDSFARELCRYFFLCLFGYAGYRDISEYQMEYQARSLGRHRVGYAAACSSFLTKLASAPFTKELFRRAAMEFVDNLAMTAQGKSSAVMLLNNVVHIYNVGIVDLLSNVRLICSFRDPRSNWAAIVGESVGHSGDVADFIRQYRKKRQQFAKAYSALQRKDLVEVVQFERFVLDRSVRTQLAERCGLDCSGQAKYTSFKPWGSAENAVLHWKYEGKREIDLIENELGEYCIDVSRPQFVAGKYEFSPKRP